MTWLRSWSSPTWHEEARREGELVYVICGLGFSVASVAHEEPVPPRGSACKHCQRRIAEKRRAEIHALDGGRASAVSRGRSALELRGGDALASDVQPMAPTILRPWPGLLSADLAASYCSVSRRQWDRLCARGAAPQPRTIGSLKRWSLADLEDWIAAGLEVTR